MPQYPESQRIKRICQALDAHDISFTSQTQISKKLTKPMPINQLLEESSPRERETNIDTRSASFLSPACQQSVGLIKIHQTSIGYKPISLICSKTKTTITTGWKRLKEKNRKQREWLKRRGLNYREVELDGTAAEASRRVPIGLQPPFGVRIHC